MIPAAADPELELLLRCVRAGDEGPLAALAADVNWERLVEDADDHGVLPLVHRRLASEAGAVPQAVLERMAEHVRGNEIRNRVLRAELIELLAAFEAHAIEVAVYKGPILAEWAYGSIGLRQFGDMDLVVRREDAAAAHALLSARGYTRSSPHGTPAWERQFLSAASECAFSSSDGAVEIDLHWSLAPRRFPARLPEARLWSRLETLRFQGTAVRTFGAQDLLLMLCVHGAKDRWRRLMWLVDVDRVVRRSGIDWDGGVAAAREARCEGMLRLGLVLASEILGTPVPSSLARPTTPALDSGAQIIRRWLLGRVPVADGAWTWIDVRRLHVLVCDGFGDRIGLLWRSLLIPRLGDWQRFSLPDPLLRAYYVLRPLRLLARWFRAVWRARGPGGRGAGSVSGTAVPPALRRHREAGRPE